MIYLPKTSNIFPKKGEKESSKGRWKREKLSGPSIFITKTFEILENQQHNDIIAWNQQGTNFTILDVDRFQQEILPGYFRHRNFSSFVRQLNMYDFHKIRNEQNKNIFEHRQFRRNAKSLLRNIRRKGYVNRKGNDFQDDSAEEQETPFEQDLSEKQVWRETEANIDNQTDIKIESRVQVSQQKINEDPLKTKLIEDFISTLPEVVGSQQQVREIIQAMKRDSLYRCLNSKQDVRRIVQRIRRRKMRQAYQNGLEELSIEQQIMVHNVDEREHKYPTLAILTSDNYLPHRSHQPICSLILFEENAYNKH